MNTRELKNHPGIRPFNRKFDDTDDEFTYIGDGEFGGKATGLAYIKAEILDRCGEEDPRLSINIPRLTVITTRYFDLFMTQNNLYDIALSRKSDERLAHHFIKAELPSGLSGDLRALVERFRSPLAVRSSSLLEDSLNAPFAGIYETKMIPNNHPDADTRFRKLAEAVKFVYASTFFSSAKSYIQATKHDLREEKMAVIIQEIVGMRHNDRFYPNISGVARSFNFYPSGHSKPGDGVVNLALGLGKAIVDGGISWSYSPEYPGTVPPYNSIDDLLKQTQLEFWAVNMGKPPTYDPVKETEYLVKSSLKEAEYDNTLTYIASTYDGASDRLNIGVGTPGPRVLNFAPLLQVNVLPLNRVVRSILRLCEEKFSAKVEIEFAATIDAGEEKKLHFGLLQVRPMAVFQEAVDLDQAPSPMEILAASDNVLGNGSVENIRDILYLDPGTFDLKHSREIAGEVARLNRELLDSRRPYLLIGFGRWGSSDPWLGIPVDWGQISGARVIVEAHAPGMERGIDMSQGSHFFHNLSNLGILYFSLKKGAEYPVDWGWLSGREEGARGKYTRHVRLQSPLSIRVDGRIRKGVILK